MADGIRHASRKEARRWGELQILEQAGAIRDLQRQIRWSLMVNDVLICTYVADAVYWDVRESRQVVEDTKSPATRKIPAYRIKKRLMRAIWNIEIREA